MDFEDAMDSYDKVLEVVGEICGEIIEPNSEEVDHTGPTLSNGRVTYAPQTQENLDALEQSRTDGEWDFLDVSGDSISRWCPT